MLDDAQGNPAKVLKEGRTYIEVEPQSQGSRRRQLNVWGWWRGKRKREGKKAV